MGTRIVVMKDGIVQQVDTPTTLYDNPANLFVACFLGSPQMNIFKAKLVEENGDIYALIGETNKVLIPKTRAERIIDKSIVGSDVLLGIRPEDVHYEQSLVETHPECVIEAVVDVIENLGNETILYLNVEGKDDYTISRVNSRYSFQQGDKVKMYLATDHAHLFDVNTEFTLMGVPDYNLIPAQLVAIDGTLAAVFGDTCIKLPEAVVKRITDKSVINNSVTLALPPKALKAARGSDSDIEIKGVGEFYDNYPRFKAVYAKVAGFNNYMIMSRPLDEEFKGGEEVVGYLDPNEVQLFNADGERIVADRDVTGNEFTGTVLENAGVYNYKLNGVLTGPDGVARPSHNKLAFDNNAAGYVLEKAEADTAMHILSKGFSIAKDDLAKSPKMVVTGNIKNLYEYRRDAVVTVEAPGFNSDLTVIINNFSGYNKGDKIKLAVDPRAILKGKYEPITETVAKAQPEGEVRYKELVAAREKEKELEAAAKASKAHKEQAATVAEEAPKKPATKKPAAKKPAAKKAPVKKPAAKKI
ncbi:MAG: ABC transporter ATP-binding protein, partial [Clostridiales bacterium]|nr:ABC transporter ATP-binding protein [Clostridiales bacterium]